MTFDDIKKEVSAYYSGKLKQHGATPQGVDWKNEESQLLRFRQLVKVIDETGDFTLLDYGCGYGQMFEFLKEEFPHCQYAGFDISADMISEAKKRHGSAASWLHSLPDNSTFDYVVASGIFNVKLAATDSEWMQYVQETLAILNSVSRRGFSFNVLTSYSDKEFMRKDLFYAEPEFFFSYCKKHFSKTVALLHDYPLYEFTILVKK